MVSDLIVVSLRFLDRVVDIPGSWGANTWRVESRRLIEPCFGGVRKDFDFHIVVFLFGGNVKVIKVPEKVLRLQHLMVEWVIT